MMKKGQSFCGEEMPRQHACQTVGPPSSLRFRVDTYDQYGVMLPKNASAKSLIERFNESQNASIAARLPKRVRV